MWVGDLTVSRQRLLSADRYAAWNAGNRHRAVVTDALYDEIQDKIYAYAKLDDSSYLQRISPGNVSVVDSEFIWRRITVARIESDVDVPVWTAGWLSSGRILNEDAGDVSGPVDGLSGRDGGVHAVDIRNGNYENFLYGRSYQLDHKLPNMMAWSHIGNIINFRYGYY